MNGYLIADTTLVDADGQRRGSLRIEGERIAEVLPPNLAPSALADIAARHDTELVDGRGLWLIPGGIDPHVHFALPAAGTVTVDDFASGTRAALIGGTTTVLDFVTPLRGQSLAAASEARLAEAAASTCDYSLHLSLTEWTDDTARQLRACARDHGLRSVKLYMAYLETIGLEDGPLAAAMRACADLDLTVLLHCEDGAEISRRQRELLAAGERSPAAHPRSRPPEVEEAAVRRALALARDAACRLYIVHVSTAGAMAAIRAARDAGQRVFAETCPQYLCFDDSVYTGDFETAAPFVMSPPLRPAADGEALWRALTQGDIDVVATDHCAFDLAQKELGREDFTRIPGGVAGVKHRLTLLYTLGVVERGLSPARWVSLLSRRPAEIFGLYPRKGSLEAGADADLVLWNPEKFWKLTAGSIYAGLRVRGWTGMVWSRGELVMELGKVEAAPGRGRLLRR